MFFTFSVVVIFLLYFFLCYVLLFIVVSLCHMLTMLHNWELPKVSSYLHNYLQKTHMLRDKRCPPCLKWIYLSKDWEIQTSDEIDYEIANGHAGCCFLNYILEKKGLRHATGNRGDKWLLSDSLLLPTFFWVLVVSLRLLDSFGFFKRHFLSEVRVWLEACYKSLSCDRVYLWSPQ